MSNIVKQKTITGRDFSLWDDDENRIEVNMNSECMKLRREE
jgi:hypothetical protein